MRTDKKLVAELLGFHESEIGDVQGLNATLPPIERADWITFQDLVDERWNRRLVALMVGVP